jgi:hypothetical protein
MARLACLFSQKSPDCMSDNVSGGMMQNNSKIKRQNRIVISAVWEINWLNWLI